MIDHLCVYADEAAAKAGLPDRIRGDTSWQADRVFVLQVWFSTTTIQVEQPWGGTSPQVLPNYDTRYWILVNYTSEVANIRAKSECVLVWNRDTGAVSKNTLTAKQYADIQAAPMPAGSTYWLGRLV